MANILNFKTKEKTKLNSYTQKVYFLLGQAYQYFYDIEEAAVVDDVDLPEFIYETRRMEMAKHNAISVMIEVAGQNRVEACFNKRVRELKQMGRHLDLKRAGII